jgi:DNA repair exonuclease SbcCD ATPase subunit
VTTDNPAVEQFISESMAALNPDGTSVSVYTPATTQTATTPTMFTTEDVERVRKQEKDKLYKKMEDSESRLKALADQVSTLEKEREEARKQAEELSVKERQLQKEREEAELSAKELILMKEQEFNSRISQVEDEWRGRLSQIEQEREAQAALLEKEREFQALNTYMQRRLAEEADAIIPELRDLVTGNSVEEVEASIDILRERSNAIVASIQQATQSQAGRPRGAQVTAPPIGPMDNQMEQQTYTLDDIQNMPMNKYAEMRDRLLSAARPQRRGF